MPFKKKQVKPLATGKDLIRWRELKEKSQEEAAEHFGVSRPWWSRMENGEEVGVTLARAVLCEIKQHNKKQQ